MFSGEDKDAEIVRLKAELTAREVNAQIGTLKAAGRVVPATETLARALLSVPGETLITLSEGAAEPVASVFLKFLQAQPPVVKFGETAGGTAEAQEAAALSNEEADWLRQNLGVDPDRVAALMADEKKEATHGNR